MAPLRFTQGRGLCTQKRGTPALARRRFALSLDPLARETTDQKMGRKKINGNLGRTVRLHIRLTPAEKAQLLEKADVQNETVSDHVRRIALQSLPTIRRADPERAALIRGLGELGKIGSNVNQIAHQLNRLAIMGKGSLLTEFDKREIDEAIRRTSDYLHNLLSHGY